jgi:putative chitinase
MTVDQLIRLGVKESTAHRYITFLNAALIRYNISTPLRQAHFFTQILHESGMLFYTQEIADGSAYEGRKDLGNTVAGDGKLFKGRGFLQITGRLTYIEYGNSIGENISAQPNLVAQPKHAADSAGWFWVEFKKDSKGRNLNAMADDDNFLRITYFVNGGFNGLQDRLRLLRKAYAVFGVENSGGRLQNVIKYMIVNLANAERRGMDSVLFKAVPNVETVNKLAEVLK